MDNTELKEFEKFVNTPFFVSRNHVKKMLRVLKKHHPNFDSPSLEKRNVYKQLFPGEKYNDTLMRKIISELNKAVERYFAYISFINDDFSYRKHLIVEANKRGLNRMAGSNLRIAFEKLEKNPVRDEDYYYNKYQLIEQNGWLLLNNQTKLINNVQDAYDNFSRAYIITVLRYYLRMLNDEIYLNAEFNYDLMNDVMSMIENTKYLEVPVVRINYYAVKTFLNRDEIEHYYKFRDSLLKHGKRLGKGPEMDLFVIIINYCILKSDIGEYHFLKEAHELGRKFLRKGYAIVRGFFLSMFFDHFVMVALDLGDIKYAENFILKYKDKLHPDEKENVLNFNYSRVALAKGQYEEALENISKLGHNYSHTRISVRLLNLQIYYELGMIDPAFHLIDSFRHFLKSNIKINHIIRERSTLFLNIMNQLLRLKAGYSRTSTQKVRNLLGDKKNILRRYWLVKKIDEIEKE